MPLQQLHRSLNHLRSRQWFRRFGIALIGMICFVGLSALPSLAKSPSQFEILDLQPPEVAEPQERIEPAPTGPGLNERQEFANFMDRFFNEEISQSRIPGAVVAVVKDGEIFFSRGYGYADLAQEIPVDSDRTLFRVASLSKLFTATATMQLYEQGLLDLEDDVNEYLDDSIQLTPPGDNPVTFAHLMTHTEGSTKRRIGLAARTAEEMTPLGNYLATHLPPIVRPPGTLYSYSSHSIALLGHLVERIANQPFSTVIDERILQPLEMQRSTFQQPPPPDLADDLAVGYQRQGNQFAPVPYLYLNIAPAASLQATATDMAHFMIAHLQNGRYENQQILQEDTAQLMHRTHFAHHPLLPGTSYGFRERFVNDIRTIGHLGSLRGYSSSLTLLPDRNIGIFIATNSFSGIHGQLLTQFFDRYFPVSDPPNVSTQQQAAVNAQQQAAVDIDGDRFTGFYRDVEYPRHTLVKLSGIFKHIQITRGESESEQDALRIQTPSLFFFNPPSTKQLVPTDEPLLFRNVDNNAFTAFEANDQGRIIFAYNPLFPKIGAYERVPWYDVIWVQLGLLAVCLVSFAFACGMWLIRPLVQRWRDKLPKSKVTFPLAKPLAGWVGALNLGFVIVFPLSLWWFGAWKLAYGMPWFAVALLCLPVLTTIFTLGLAIASVLAWKNQTGSVMERSQLSLVTLAALGFIGFLAHWNLLGFQF